MKNKILQQLTKLPYFTIAAIEQLNDCTPQTARQLASRWERHNKLIRLKQGHYMTREFYLSHKHQLGFTEMISAIIQPFSYVSLEYVLQKHEVLTEAVFPVTAVTLKNSQKIQNKLGHFIYRHLKEQLFTGFREEFYLGIHYKEASKSKALFDYFYFRPEPILLTKPDFNLAEEMRLKLDEWTSTEMSEFASYIKLAASPKMNKIYQNLQGHAWQ